MQLSPIKDRRQWQCSKAAFLKTWPGGYSENFSVYTPKAGVTEQEVEDTMLKPFYDSDGLALEVGCGSGFWVKRYLVPNFKSVIGVDIIPFDWAAKSERFTYIELEEGDYSLKCLEEDSVDFVWCFGVFCHLALSSVEVYLRSIFRVLKPGRSASLYFSDDNKRPWIGEWNVEPDPDSGVGWTENDLDTTFKMLSGCGFTQITEVLPQGKDTLVTAVKP